MGWGDIPELGNSRDKLGIRDEGEGPLTRLGAQRRAHTASSLCQPSRSGGLLAWLSPVSGQGHDGVLMGPGGAGSCLVQAWGGGPGNTASLSQGLSSPAGGGSGGCGFCSAAGPLGFPAPGGSHAGRLGKVTKPLSPVEKGVRPLVCSYVLHGNAAGVLATQVAWR